MKKYKFIEDKMDNAAVIRKKQNFKGINSLISNIYIYVKQNFMLYYGDKTFYLAYCTWV